MWRAQEARANISYTPDPTFIELPEHLKYKEPVADRTFHGVESRYQYGASPKRAPQEFDKPKPATPTRNSPFKDVESRFRSPAHAYRRSPAMHNTSTAPEPLKKTESIRVTGEYAQHKRVASAAGFGGACSKFFDMYHYQQSPPGTQTRRQVVEDTLKDEKKKMHNEVFRPTVSHTSTFSEMERKNEELTKWKASPKKSSSTKISQVMDYVKNGTPIKGTPEPASPKPRTRSPVSSRPFYGGGGAGGGNGTPRANSPKKQIRDMEQTKVTELRQGLVRAKTKTPPRVASLEHPFIVRSKAPDPYSRQASNTSVNSRQSGVGAPRPTSSPIRRTPSSSHQQQPSRTNSPSSQQPQQQQRRPSPSRSMVGAGAPQQQQQQQRNTPQRRVQQQQRNTNNNDDNTQDFDVSVRAPPSDTSSNHGERHSSSRPGQQPTKLNYYKRQKEIFPMDPPKTAKK